MGAALEQEHVLSTRDEFKQNAPLQAVQLSLEAGYIIEKCKVASHHSEADHVLYILFPNPNPV